MNQYDPKNIDKALKRMEDADRLRSIGKQSNNTNIMSFFDGVEEEHKLQKLQSAAEVKKDEYLKSVELLKTLIQKKGTQIELTRILAVGLLIETTDFLNIPLDVKKSIKENMIWCNKQYEKYVDITK